MGSGWNDISATEETKRKGILHWVDGLEGNIEEGDIARA